MQARQHHGEPVAVVMAAVFAVFAPRALEYAVAFQVARVVGIAHASGVFIAAFGEFVGIDKGIVAGIVGRVNVNHLHAAGVGFLQDFQCFEVFGFDKHVLRAVEICGFFFAGSEGAGSGTLEIEIGGGFACPIELITFARAGKVFCAEDEFELFKVDLLFAKDFRKDLFEF